MAATSPRKHPGFKGGESGVNGFFAADHPAEKRTPLQVALLKALSTGANPQLGVITSPMSTSVGE